MSIKYIVIYTFILLLYLDLFVYTFIIYKIPSGIANYCSITQTRKLSGTGEIVQWSRAYTTFAEDPSSVSTTHVRQYTATCHSIAKGSNALFRLPQPPGLICTHLSFSDTDAQNNLKIKQIFN